MLDERRFQKQTVAKNIHNIMLEERKKLSISGVIEVDSFNEEKIELTTEGGALEIGGTNLKIQKISVDTGDCTVEGDVDKIVYHNEDLRSSRGIMARIFR